MDDYIEIDPPKISEPSMEEIKEYMQWLGGDIEKDQDLIYIAREALLSDIPEDWKIYQQRAGAGEVFYFNRKTGESIWDHPLDKYYKELFDQQKELKEQNSSKPKVHQNISPTSDNPKKHNVIKLTSKCLKHFPFQNFEENFTFFVNGSKFKTSNLMADLISPKIWKMHMTDPTIDHFVVNTTNKGDFNYILGLFNFEYNQIPIDQIPFVIEVIELFELNSIKSNFYKHEIITIHNVVDLLKQHEKFSVFFEKKFNEEIDFLASHFHQILKIGKKDEVKSLSPETIELIIGHPNLVLKDEDQLLNFIDELYSLDNNFSILYEYVDFLSTSTQMTSKFLNTIQFECINKIIWEKISLRFQQSSLSRKYYNNHSDRYFNEKNDFAFDGINAFNGILNKIGDDVAISASSIFKYKYSPKNVIDYSDNVVKYFQSKDQPNSWILFDFSKASVCLSHYSIQSDFSKSETMDGPKSWVIEGSNDNEEWTVIDEQEKVEFTRRKRFIHTFSIDDHNENSFSLIRMRLTDKNWSGKNVLKFGSIEFFGKLYNKS